jgi:SH3 domain protein
VIKRVLLTWILLAFCHSVLAQETENADKDRQYVTDQLRLSLYEEASSQSRVLKLLRSGDLLIVDEIRGPYALVTAPDGTHGWVKRGFLVSNPTANILLREEQQKSASLFDELEKLGNSKVVIDTYEKDMDELMAKIDGLEASNREADETIARLEQEIGAAQQQESSVVLQPAGLPTADIPDILKTHWKVIAGLVVAIVLLTFLLSKLIIEARIKRKFHGIKIW